MDLLASPLVCLGVANLQITNIMRTTPRDHAQRRYTVSRQVSFHKYGFMRSTVSSLGSVDTCGPWTGFRRKPSLVGLH